MARAGSAYPARHCHADVRAMQHAPQTQQRAACHLHPARPHVYRHCGREEGRRQQHAWKHWLVHAACPRATWSGCHGASQRLAQHGRPCHACHPCHDRHQPPHPHARPHPHDQHAPQRHCCGGLLPCLPWHPPCPAPACRHAQAQRPYCPHAHWNSHPCEHAWLPAATHHVQAMLTACAVAMVIACEGVRLHPCRCRLLLALMEQPLCRLVPVSGAWQLPCLHHHACRAVARAGP